MTNETSKNINTQLRKLKVFLCSSSADEIRAKALYQRLELDGFDPWLEAENLLPGQDWRMETAKAVHASDVIIICLSPEAITQEGNLHRQMREAFDTAEDKPEEDVFTIPLKFSECQMPWELKRKESVNYLKAGHKSNYVQKSFDGARCKPLTMIVKYNQIVGGHRS